jgi:hypothetical protein
MPTTVLTTIIGLIAGIIKDWITLSLQSKAALNEALYRKAGMEIQDRQDARAKGTKEFQFTRRIIALSFTGALVIAPVIWAFINPTATVSVPRIGYDGSFWDVILPWREAKEVVQYVEVKVMVYVLTLLDMFGLIIGFYFGSGGTRSRG